MIVDAILLGDAGEKLVNDERGLRVEAGVGLVAEEILRIHDDGAGDGDTLLHTSRNLAWKLASRPVEVDAVETLLRPSVALGGSHIGEHIKGKAHILQDGEGVEEGRTLEDHAHLTAHLHALVLRHVHKVAPVVEHLATRRIEEAHKDLHQHSLARARLTDNEIGLAVVEDGVDVAQDGFIAKGLVYMLDFYHGFLLF